jgi:hypothetical protein
MGPAVKDERGTTILEVLIASALLVTLMAGLMAMSAVAISTTENQGHLAARTTEYAQDKMEQLLALAYGDLISDTRTFPAAGSGGSGLTVGGLSNPTTTITTSTQTFVDYLDENGNLVAASGATPPSSWYYKRVWKIDDSTTDVSLPTNLKKITVGVTLSRGFGGFAASTSVLTCLKTSPF